MYYLKCKWLTVAGCEVTGARHWYAKFWKKATQRKRSIFFALRPGFRGLLAIWGKASRTSGTFGLTSSGRLWFSKVKMTWDHLVSCFPHPDLVKKDTPKEDFGGLVVVAACSCTDAIDRSSRAGYRLILVLTSLANQNAAFYLRQSGRLSGHQALATKGEFYSHSLVARLNTNATSIYRSEGCIFPNTFSA